MDQRHATTILWIVLSLLLCCTPAEAWADDFELLAEWMTGSFSSTAQAAEDEDYYDIRLEMARIWSDRDDGYWLYVEQAAADNLERPYRQRVYRLLETEDGAFRSEVYSLPDPLRFAGDWEEEDPISSLSPDSLRVREGCAVILRRVDEESFAGATEGKACLSKLRGASYAVAEVEVRAGQIQSWDRGYDDEGQQVWGAEKGPYVFLRKEDEE